MGATDYIAKYISTSSCASRRRRTLLDRAFGWPAVGVGTTWAGDNGADAGGDATDGFWTGGDDVGAGIDDEED